MKILVLAGSPHKHGTSNTLVEEYIRGAKEASHEVEVYDCAKGDLHPCMGCDYCHMDGTCVQKDDGNAVLQKILKSDCIVFATPVYYFGMSAQLKMMIDRFYARTTRITMRRLKAVVLATAWNDDEVVMRALEIHMDTILDYMDMEKVGTVYAKGAGVVSMMPKKYLQEAYHLGKSLK